MWPWRLRRRKHEQLWWQLVSVSTFIHCGMLVLLLFVYRGQFSRYDITVGRVHDPKTPVVLMPLMKSIPQKKGSTGGVKSGKKGKAVASANKQKKTGAPQKQKNVAAQKTKSVVKPPQQIKPDQKSKATLAQPEKQMTVKKESPKKESIDTKKKIEKKEIVEQVPLKKEALIKKEEIVPPVQEVKKDDVVQQDPVAAAPQQQEQVISNQIPEDGLDVSSEQDDVQYIGQAERDAAQMQLLIQQEVEKHWRPPVGLSAHLECDVQVKVGWDRKAELVLIQKPSGVLVYDIHARTAVVAMQFPHMACGKELCIHFKQ
ncbi:MAG TPA: hypothetical protein VGT41_03085 [Candidatus Babeliales bacterium]|nr:hypothetical protein [Candidatus Babeliales bacterium]